MKKYPAVTSKKYTFSKIFDIKW